MQLPLVPSDHFVLSVESQNECHNVTVEVHSRDGGLSTLTEDTVNLPGDCCCTSSGFLFFDHSDFIPQDPFPADFSEVGAVVLSVDATLTGDAIEGLVFEYDFFGGEKK